MKKLIEDLRKEPRQKHLRGDLRKTQKDICKNCGNKLKRIECWQCEGEGVSDHDCGEDVCACRFPEPNVTCGICNGEGSWMVCMFCTAHKPSPSSEEIGDFE
jgi:predicted amidophosphoribosyltransferase